MSLAREVGTGQVAVYQQYEIERNEQSAQAGRMHTIIADAGAKVEYLENMLQDTRSQILECTGLLSGSITCVYALEGEVSSLTQATSIEEKEVARAYSVNDELKTWREQAMAANTTLRDQLSTAEASQQPRLPPDPEVDMRSDDETSLRTELSSCLAREHQWSEEAKRSKVEVH